MTYLRTGDIARIFDVSKTVVHNGTQKRPKGLLAGIPVRRLGKTLIFVGEEVDEWFASKR